jgi:ABC-type transport system substrate-binding protein
MLRTQFAAMTLAMTALAASGCGGSSKSGSTTTAVATSTATTAVTTPLPPVTAVKVATGTPLAHAQFIAKADAICARANVKRATINVVNKSEYARELPQAAIYDATETDELSKLVPPAALAHDWAQIVGDFRLFTEYTDTVARYAQANKLNAGVSVIQTAERIHRRLAKIAARDGLTHCARFK